MYSLKIFTDNRNCIDAVVSGKTILELCERYYLYHQMHEGWYYLDMYENDNLSSRDLLTDGVKHTTSILKKENDYRKWARISNGSI